MCRTYRNRLVTIISIHSMPWRLYLSTITAELLRKINEIFLFNLLVRLIMNRVKIVLKALEFIATIAIL